MHDRQEKRKEVLKPKVREYNDNQTQPLIKMFPYKYKGEKLAGRRFVQRSYPKSHINATAIEDYRGLCGFLLSGHVEFMPSHGHRKLLLPAHAHARARARAPHPPPTPTHLRVCCLHVARVRAHVCVCVCVCACMQCRC